VGELPAPINDAALSILGGEDSDWMDRLLKASRLGMGYSAGTPRTSASSGLTLSRKAKI
jgi:hypothetical protein